MQHYVTETERWSVINAMRTAADACVESAKALREQVGAVEGPSDHDGNLRVAAQLESQAVEYRRIAHIAEIADHAYVEYDEADVEFDALAEQARVEKATGRIRILHDAKIEYDQH